MRKQKKKSRRYYWNYDIREKMKGAERVLKGYYDEDDYVAKRKSKDDPSANVSKRNRQGF